jgi:anti-sigma factor RsiW
MEPPVSSFDDPALKSALQRSLPKERAPEELRQRIAAMAADARSEAPPMRLGPEAPSGGIPIRNARSSWQRWGRLAAAAVFAIAATVTAVLINRQGGPAPGYEIANSVFKGMVNAHELRKSGAASPDTVTTLAAASQLSKTLGRGVLAADLTQDGWTFEGGAVRNVASFQAAQLYFTKGNASISVLSLPASAATTAKDGSSYETTFQGTPIAGYVKQGGLYCIVGQSTDNSLTIQDVKSLLDKHRGEIIKS